jgi:hypothetical protein
MERVGKGGNQLGSEKSINWREGDSTSHYNEQEMFRWQLGSTKFENSTNKNNNLGARVYADHGGL